MASTSNYSNDKCMNNSDTSSTTKSSTTSKQPLGLAGISYADYIILSSTLSYAIAEELNDIDLDMLIVFTGMITSDLALLRTKRGIIKGINTINKNMAEEAIIGSEESTLAGENIDIQSANRGEIKKGKRIKKIKRRKLKKVKK